MTRVHLSKDGSNAYRLRFLYFHIQGECRRMEGPEEAYVMAAALEGEIVAAGLVWAALGGRVEREYEIGRGVIK